MGKFSRACLFLVLVLATAGHAVRDDVKVINRYGQVGLWHTHSAKTLKRGGLQANVWGSYTTHEDFIKRVISIDDAGPTEHNSVPDINAGTFNVSVGYGFTDYLDLAVMLPVYLDKMSDIRAAGITSNTPYGGAGDMEVSMKFQYPPYKHNEFFRMAYYGAVTVPMGENNPGRIPKHNYYLMSDTTLYYGNEDGKPEVDMKMLWTWDFREIIDEFPVLFHFNYGLRWNTNPDINHNFLLNAGIDVRPREWFSIFLDYSAEPSFSAIELRERKLAIPGIGEDSVISLGPLNDPMRLSPGITFLVPGGFNFGAGAQISVARSEDEYMLARESGKDSVDEIWMETAVEPKVKFTASIGWNGSVIPQDTDGDGLLDDDDRCPRDPEDFDGFEDQDGCPDYDNDGDGIPDSLDNCPNEVGPRDNDGCPVHDSDGDGIPDSLDQCPDEAEDFDGFEDEDGCPDYDNDGDGIPDSLDQCPEDPEDKDGFEDEDGCPDPDNDEDGIADVDDECPNKAGPADNGGCPVNDADGDGVPDSADKCPQKPGPKDNNGCPVTKAKEIKRGRIVLKGVNFESGKAVLTRGSYETLDKVVESLKDWPEINLRIEGHTDAQGSADYNRELSYKRAKAVLDYFVAQGIKGSRLRAVGKGEADPIANNATASGRAENRRVELHRTDN